MRRLTWVDTLYLCRTNYNSRLHVLGQTSGRECSSVEEGEWCRVIRRTVLEVVGTGMSYGPACVQRVIRRTVLEVVEHCDVVQSSGPAWVQRVIRRTVLEVVEHCDVVRSSVCPASDQTNCPRGGGALWCRTVQRESSEWSDELSSRWWGTVMSYSPAHSARPHLTRFCLELTELQLVKHVVNTSVHCHLPSAVIAMGVKSLD